MHKLLSAKSLLAGMMLAAALFSTNASAAGQGLQVLEEAIPNIGRVQDLMSSPSYSEEQAPEEQAYQMAEYLNTLRLATGTGNIDDPNNFSFAFDQLPRYVRFIEILKTSPLKTGQLMLRRDRPAVTPDDLIYRALSYFLTEYRDTAAPDQIEHALTVMKCPAVSSYTNDTAKIIKFRFATENRTRISAQAAAELQYYCQLLNGDVSTAASTNDSWYSYFISLGESHSQDDFAKALRKEREVYSNPGSNSMAGSGLMSSRALNAAVQTLQDPDDYDD